MSRVIVGTWGKSLAVRVPREVAQTLGLCEGEPVEVEARDGELVIHRSESESTRRARAHAAAEAIRANSRGRTLGGIALHELIDEGRKY